MCYIGAMAYVYTERGTITEDVTQVCAALRKAFEAAALVINAETSTPGNSSIVMAVSDPESGQNLTLNVASCLEESAGSHTEADVVRVSPVSAYDYQMLPFNTIAVRNARADACDSLSFDETATVAGSIARFLKTGTYSRHATPGRPFFSRSAATALPGLQSLN